MKRRCKRCSTPRPDFAYLHAELRRRGVTRLLLWEEYKSAHPDGWQYSVFCEQYRRWLATCRSTNSWLVSFLDFDLGYFDEVEGRVEPGPNPFAAKVLTMPPV